MYLSRLVLNPGGRAVRNDLADCQAMHRRIMSAFPDLGRHTDSRAALGVLYRVETGGRDGNVVVIVQSRVKPDWSRLPEGYLVDTADEIPNPECKPVEEQYAAIEAGYRLRFRLRVNPTRKIDTRSSPDGRRSNGRRVELRDDSARIGWLERKGKACGFEVLTVRANSQAPNVVVVAEPKIGGTRPVVSPEGGEVHNARLTFRPVLFEGELRVTDVALFRAALAAGIGPGKAYGFGLLSVAPAGG